MSAIGGKADIVWTDAHGRFWPVVDICRLNRSNHSVACVPDIGTEKATARHSEHSGPRRLFLNVVAWFSLRYWKMFTRILFAVTMQQGSKTCRNWPATLPTAWVAPCCC